MRVDAAARGRAYGGMAADSADPAAAGDLAGYYRRLERAHLAPLWESLAALAPAQPSPRARPFQWSYAEVRPQLMEAGGLISAEKAERRVVVLANPGVGLQATDTLYAGLQLILPGEVAPPHRHSQAALRFVLEGRGAYTAVDGRRAEMSPGDFIVTPAWSWHEHGGGDEPVVWLDGLDVPLVGFLGAGFREEQSAPAVPGPPRRFAFPYAEAREQVERLRKAGPPDPRHGYRLDYLDPETGRSPMATLGARLQLLPAGFEGRAYRSTDSAVLVAVEGRVAVTAADETFELGPRDVLALPGWTAWRLLAQEEAVVFAFSDAPAHQALGLWREEALEDG